MTSLGRHICIFLLIFKSIYCFAQDSTEVTKVPKNKISNHFHLGLDLMGNLSYTSIHIENFFSINSNVKIGFRTGYSPFFNWLHGAYANVPTQLNFLFGKNKHWVDISGGVNHILFTQQSLHYSIKKEKKGGYPFHLYKSIGTVNIGYNFIDNNMFRLRFYVSGFIIETLEKVPYNSHKSTYQFEPGGGLTFYRLIKVK